MSKITLSDASVASVRTSVNGAWMIAFASLFTRATGWDLTVDDLILFMPALLFIGAIFYRLSRVVADRWPFLQYVLFGIPKVPVYVEPPGPDADANTNTNTNTNTNNVIQLRR